MYIGYARVSTYNQNLDSQIDALTQAGCEKILTDKLSGVAERREGFDDALKALRAGDTLVVTKLDRLGRSLKHLIHLVNDLNDKNINLKVLHGNIDTSTPAGKLYFGFSALMAEFERDITIERTMCGLSAARARGRFGGRPKKLNKKDLKSVMALCKDTTIELSDIAKRFNISRTTLWRYTKNYKNKTKEEKEEKEQKVT